MYIDSSCYVKLLWDEPGSDAVTRIVGDAPRVVVSSLVVCEAAVAAQRVLSRADTLEFRRREQRLLAAAPMEHAPLDFDLTDFVRKQLGRPRSVYCRALDRLHLAAMQALGLRHLLTADRARAKAARALRFKVTMP